MLKAYDPGSGWGKTSLGKMVGEKGQTLKAYGSGSGWGKMILGKMGDEWRVTRDELAWTSGRQSPQMLELVRLAHILDLGQISVCWVGRGREQRDKGHGAYRYYD